MYKFSFKGFGVVREVFSWRVVLFISGFWLREFFFFFNWIRSLIVIVGV